MKLLFQELQMLAGPCLVFEVRTSQSISLNLVKQPRRPAPIIRVRRNTMFDLSNIVFINEMLSINFEDLGIYI